MFIAVAFFPVCVFHLCSCTIILGTRDLSLGVEACVRKLKELFKHLCSCVINKYNIIILTHFNDSVKYRSINFRA